LPPRWSDATGRNLGLIQLSDKEDGSEFEEADEAMLVQLAQLGSAAVEQAQAEAALRRQQRPFQGGNRCHRRRACGPMMRPAE
jgi:GAF domain-containing protein